MRAIVLFLCLLAGAANAQIPPGFNGVLNVPTSGSPCTSVYTNNLVQWNPLDAGSPTPDASGNGLTGTLVNGPTYVPAQNTNGLSFTAASTQKVTFASNPLFGTTTGTVCGWVKPTASAYDFIYENRTSVTVGWILFVNTSGFAEAYYQGGVGNNSDLQGSVNLVDGNFHFLSATINATVFLLYVDGVQVNSGTITLAAFGNNSGEIGAAYDSTSSTGIVDDVKIYSVPLTAPQIGQIYTNGFYCHLP